MDNFEKRGIKYTLLIIATTAICMMLCFLFMFKCAPDPVSTVDEVDMVIIDTTSVDVHTSELSDASKTNKTDNGSHYDTYLYNMEPFILFKVPGKKGYGAMLKTYIKKYIDMVAPNNKIDSHKLLELCKKYDICVFTIMAFAQLESNFGVLGNSTKTNSLFNLTKNGNPLIFDDINDSIEPFLMLICEHDAVCADNNMTPTFVDTRGIQYTFNASSQYKDRLIEIIHNHYAAEHMPEEGNLIYIEN